MKKINHGKRFEQDFQQSAQKVMSYIRLNDPGSSFNIHCQGCDKQRTRFAPQHLCDAIAYKYPNQYLFELKSVKGKSVPFKNIVKNEKDKRLQKMCDQNQSEGVKSFVVLNFRSEDNHTYALCAENVLNFINSPSDFGYPENRKSIPIEFVGRLGIGILIPSSIKKTRYSYVLNNLFIY